jgi:hypothetical protein
MYSEHHDDEIRNDGTHDDGNLIHGDDGYAIHGGDGYAIHDDGDGYDHGHESDRDGVSFEFLLLNYLVQIKPVDSGLGSQRLKKSNSYLSFAAGDSMILSTGLIHYPLFHTFGRLKKPKSL